MRRTDREVTDKLEMVKIIEKCDVCRVAFAKDNIPYLVPLNFGYEYRDGELALYFHCAQEGKKMDLIKDNPLVAFEMDCSHQLLENEIACKCSMAFESVIGTGRIVILNAEQKEAGLRCIMKHYVEDRDFIFEQEKVDAIEVLKLTAAEFTGKRKIVPR